MRYGRFLLVVSLACLLAPLGLAQSQIGGGTCSSASLSGTYSLVLSGRALTAAGVFAGTYQANGTAVFDGLSNVTFTGTVNTNQAAGTPFTYSGTYTIPSNCYGTISPFPGSTTPFTLVVWDGGLQYNMTGSDATYVYSGSGTSTRPVCATPTLSGEFTYSASGSTLSGSTQTGSADELGLFQFDGAGNVTASYAISSEGIASAAVTATGTYSVTPACLASATLIDSTGNTNLLNFVITGVYGANAEVTESNPQFVRNGSAHAEFLNPTQSIGNVASYVVNATPAGSVFTLFGTDLATKTAQAEVVPLPITLLSTKVTVNGEAAPLFYVSTGQVDAQMPWDIPGGAVASVVVKNGSSTSNAAAVYVPATGTPGISVYNANRAVVVNQDGSVNSTTAAASVGDEVVAYFTGGGPVDAVGLVTGAPAPDTLSPLTPGGTVTIGTVSAVVKYIGLTPESIGLYQANFIVPAVAKGNYAVTITIQGQVSNKPVMTIGN